ncbi:MAG: hypothetical protein M3441_26150 [Chloroflexota bacterium]|nr:hypothetical protein [Chloroflexota bacterium]
MSDFAPKEVIQPRYHQLEVLSVEKTETYGPQVAFKLRVVGTEHDGYVFTDYATRDENTGQIKQGTKAWSIYEACLGVGFHERIKSLDDIVGKQFVTKVEETKTGSRNKVEFGTTGPVPPGGFGDDVSKAS